MSLRILIKALVFTAGLLLSTQLLADEQANGVKLLFVEASAKSVLQAVPNKPNTYTLIMKDLYPYVIYFSDRPKRIANVIPIEQFVSNWNKGHNSFSKEAPNADISAIAVKDLVIKKPTNFAVTLTGMQYDPKQKTLIYTLTILHSLNLSSTQETHFKHTVVFIDDWCTSCIVGG